MPGDVAGAERAPRPADAPLRRERPQLLHGLGTDELDLRARLQEGPRLASPNLPAADHEGLAVVDDEVQRNRAPNRPSIPVHQSRTPFHPSNRFCASARYFAPVPPFTNGSMEMPPRAANFPYTSRYLGFRRRARSS